MDYQRAKDVRGKSFSSLLLDNIVGGGGVGASLNKTISEKTQASVKGIKQAFDPLQIAKTLTFGGNIAPALLGRAMGRSKGDIKFFTGRTRKRRSAFQLDNSGTGQANLAIGMLSGIYDLLVERDKLRKQEILDRQKESKREEDYAEFANQELIKALTARRKKEKKVYRDEKGRFAKEPVAQTPTPPTPPAPPSPPPIPKPTTPPAPQATTPKPTTPAPTPKPTVASPVKPTAIIPPIVAGIAATSLSDSAIARIKSKEGFASKAYFDPKSGASRDLYSVGYGHQINDKELKSGFIPIGEKQIPVVGNNGKDTVISKEDAEKLLRQDYPKYEEYAKKLPNFEKLNTGAQVALVDMTYNMGIGWANKWPIFTKQLETLDLTEAAKNIQNSKYASQVKSRASENSEALKNGLRDVPKQEARENIPSTIIESSTKENRELKESLNKDKRAQNTVTNNITTNTSQKTEEREEPADDKPAFMKKRRM